MTLNSNTPKKLGRPVGSKNKRKRVAKKVGSKDKAFKQANEQLGRIPTIPPIPMSVLKDSMIKDQEIKILNLQHQAVGYRAVISYLENKLGTK
jgi:hypothetical protein